MIPALQDLVISYCQNLDDALIFQGYHLHLDYMQIRLPKSYQLLSIGYCASQGHLLSVHYLHAVGRYSEDAMNCAAVDGQLEVIQYLYAVGKKGSLLTIDLASRNGRLDIVKYLHRNGVLPTFSTIDGAAENGHLPVVRYLYDQQVKPKYAMQHAVGNGHFDVVKYLFEGGMEPADEALEVANDRGHHRVMDYFRSVGLYFF